MIKNLIKKVIYREKSDSKSYINYLRNLGCNIGSGTTIYSPKNLETDTTRPWLINIEKNVQITKDVTILTHGYDLSVIKGVYGEICGSSGKVTIGDNVFIEIKLTILKGVTVGNNVL